jgi:RimJ/RimL family protein N-acetyltransferase
VSVAVPVELQADVPLRDGSIAHVRPVRPEDEPGLLSLLCGLSPEDLRLRFFSLGANLARAAHYQATADQSRSFGLVATSADEKRIVGHAMYAPGDADGCAEVAFCVCDDFRGQGIASQLLGRLAEAAAMRGLNYLEAVVLPENQRMLAVLRHSGLMTAARFEWGVVRVSLTLQRPGDA